MLNATSRINPALIVAIIALVVAIGGTAYAVKKVSGKQIKDESVTGKDVKDGSLTADDADDSLQGEAGPRGPQGLQGPQGPEGPPATANFTTVTATSPTNVNGKEFGADCPEGSEVIGGGFVIGGPTGAEVGVPRSYAIDEDTWFVRAAPVGAPANFHITVIAHCVS
jgi:hypothetical protein